MKRQYDNNELKTLKGKPKVYSIASYDIETATKKNIFIQGGFIDERGQYKSHTDKDKMIEYMLNHTNSKTKIFATMNRFDFFGLFKHTKDWNKYRINMRGGLLIWKEYKHMNFYDTLSYCKASVESIGEMLKLPKIKFDVSKNMIHMSKWKMQKMTAYNKRDCEVTRQFMIGFQQVINELGGQIGQTIGSTAMDLFRRKYLKETIHHEYIKNEQFSNGDTVRETIFKAYHGGRTEMFKRGFDKNNVYYKYDFNSLYPSVMLNDYPKPSSAIMSENKLGKLNTDSIMKYEGIAECEVVVPYMYYPILPINYEDKLIFPIGRFRDYFTYAELRLAIANGVKILNIYKTITYTKLFSPFKTWVNELYALRLKYSRENNLIYKDTIKLLLNNLYGKFGMRHVSKIELMREEDRNDSDLSQDGFQFSEFNGYGIKETPIDCNQSYIIPIFAVYTTAFARIKLWKELTKLNGIYCDTDSIFTKVKMNDSKELGELKLEAKSRGLNIFKLKHYSEIDFETGKMKPKIKGLTLSKDESIRNQEFEDSINGNDIRQMRIIGLKESLKGKYEINEVVYITKKFDAFDNKRMWIRPYSKNEMRDSKPRIIGFKNVKELRLFYDSI